MRIPKGFPNSIFLLIPRFTYVVCLVSFLFHSFHFRAFRWVFLATRGNFDFSNALPSSNWFQIVFSHFFQLIYAISRLVEWKKSLGQLRKMIQILEWRREKKPGTRRGDERKSKKNSVILPWPLPLWNCAWQESSHRKYGRPGTARRTHTERDQPSAGQNRIALYRK